MAVSLYPYTEMRSAYSFSPSWYMTPVISRLGLINILSQLLYVWFLVRVGEAKRRGFAFCLECNGVAGGGGGCPGKMKYPRVCAFFLWRTQRYEIVGCGYLGGLPTTLCFL